MFKPTSAMIKEWLFQSSGKWAKNLFWRQMKMESQQGLSSLNTAGFNLTHLMGATNHRNTYYI